MSVNSDDMGQWSGSEDSSVPGRNIQDWVAENMGSACPVNMDFTAQHGLVHRLDRNTSGALLVAKTYRGYYMAQLRFVARRVRKEYLCLCHGFAIEPHQYLEAPLRWMQQEDGAMRSVPGTCGGKSAKTEVLAVAHFVCPAGTGMSLVRVQLHTGRRHQIRAHLASTGHPLVGDRAYGGQVFPWCSRTFLHACRLGIDVGDGPLDVSVQLPQDLVAALDLLVANSWHSRVVIRLCLFP